MKYFLGLPERPFRAIQKGIKKVEGRVPTREKTLPGKNIYAQMKTGDIITFENEDTGENIDVIVTFVHHYQDVHSMLKKEGVGNVMSSEPKTIQHGIESYHKLPHYEENIPSYGIYAIGVKPMFK